MTVIFNNQPTTVVVSQDNTEISLVAGSDITINNSTLPVATDSTLTGDGITPLSVVQATEAQLGGAEVATQVEADAGTDDTTIITPLKLANYSGFSTAVTSVFARTGAIVALASDYDANQIDYDNTTSGLTATDVQGAIDEVEGRVDQLESLGRFRGVHDASTGLVPTAASSTVLPGDPINSGDYWRVSVAGTIPGLGGEAMLEVGDIILANINLATLPADFTGLNTNSGSEQFTTTVALIAGANVVAHNLGTQYNTIEIRNQTSGAKVNFIGVTATGTTSCTINSFSAFTAKIVITSGFN